MKFYGALNILKSPFPTVGRPVYYISIIFQSVQFLEKIQLMQLIFERKLLNNGNFKPLKNSKSRISGHIMGYIRGDILDKPPGRSNDQLRMCIRSSYHSYGFTQDEQLIRNWWFRGTKRYFWLFWVVLVTVSTDLKLKWTCEPLKIFIWSSYGLHLVFSWQLKRLNKAIYLKSIFKWT